MPLTIESLLGEYHDSFLGEIMGRSALCVDGWPQKWEELVSWGDVNRLLEYGALSYPRLCLMKDGQEIPGTIYTTTGANGYPRLLASALRATMMSGATLVIDSVEQLHEPLSNFCRILEERLRVPVQADLYASAAAGSTSPLQWNDHESFVIQVEGVTQWELHHPTVNSGADGREPPPPTGAPAWSGSLMNGQVLYVPKRWWYRDRHLNEPTLYAGMTFRNPTAMDFVKRLADHLWQLDLMKTDYPMFGSAEEQGAFLRLVQREIGAGCARPGLILGCLQESQCFSEARAHFALPWNKSPESVSNAEESAIVWRLRFPGTEMLKHLTTEDAVEVFLDGRAVRFRGNTALVLERMLGFAVSTVGQAISACSGFLSREQVAESLIDLMNHDVLGLGAVNASCKSLSIQDPDAAS